MPSITENISHWGEKYGWSAEGDEWSARWGGVEAQWFGAIYPRIREFLPATTVLEIAPGFGRWTQFLKDHCENLVAVDINEICIDRCKERFSSSGHVTCHVNDGKSLDMVPDNSVDFVFSFDSLVHAEADVIEAYLAQLERKLTPDGVGFLHHSNIGEYSLRWRIRSRLMPAGLRKHLTKKGFLNYYHWRAFSMTAKLFQEYCEKAGLQCISQELINWGGGLLIDCFSVFTKKSSSRARHNMILRNPDFMREADYISRLSSLYSITNSRVVADRPDATPNVR